MRQKGGSRQCFRSCVLRFEKVRPHPSSSEEWDSGCIRRMDAAATVLDEIMRTPDKGIPEELLDSAKCVAVIPSMVKIGFIFGGRHGRD